MIKSMKQKQKNVSKNRKPIMNRLQKYSQGYQGLAVLSGVLGQTAVCSAAITALDVGPLTNGTTLNAAGTGSLGNSTVNFNVSQSSNVGDTFQMRGDAGRIIFNVTGGSGDGFAINGTTNTYNNLKYFPVSSVVDSSNSFNYGFVSYDPAGGNLDDWLIDRPSGAIGFRLDDGEFGYIHVSWVAATKTLTFLGTGFFDDTPGAGITVAAVPEPSDYAAALGLGALGIAYYRRRPGNKTRSKN